MKRLKILQDWPIRHNGKELNCGDTAEFDDKTADWLLSNQRAELIKSPKTDDKNSTQASASLKTTDPENPQHRQATIQAAVAKMLAADPNNVPKCPDIAAITGLQNIRKEERDAAVAALKTATPENETTESKGE